MNVSESGSSSSQSNIPSAVGKPASAGQSSAASKVGQKIVGKAAEAEGKHKPPRMVRSMSASHIVLEESRISRQQEKTEIQKRDGVLWECKCRVPNKSGGYVYKFRLRDEFNDITGEKIADHTQNLDQKMAEIFPAVEPLVRRDLLYYMSSKPSELEGLIRETVSIAFETLPPKEQIAISRDHYTRERYRVAFENRERNRFEIGAVLQKLGYKLSLSGEEIFLEVPDRTALLANWEDLRAEIPRLDKLDVVSSEGVAGDMEFVSAYLCHDALLSDGIEFIHDQFSHVVPALSLMISSARAAGAFETEGATGYAKERYRLAKLAAKGYRTIMVSKGALQKAEEESKTIPEEKDKENPETIRILKLRFQLVETALGAFVDTISTYEDISVLQRITQENMEMYFREYQSEDLKLDYLRKRHGEEVANLPIGESWEIFKILERMLDEMRLSVAQTAPVQLSVAKEIENRQAVTWECIGRTPHVVDGELQGYVYKYRLRDEFNNVTGGDGSENELEKRTIASDDARAKIFPAVEPNLLELAELYIPKEGESVPNWVKSEVEDNAKPRNQEGLKYRELYSLARQLGYSLSEEKIRGRKEFVLEVPDGVAVTANWNKLRKDEGLSEACVPIDIISSEGIASDDEFILAYFNHDAILSNGKEFLHDSFGHVLPTLRLIRSSRTEDKPIYKNSAIKEKKFYPAYSDEKKRIVGLLRPYYDRFVAVRTALENGSAKLDASQVEIAKEQVNYFVYVLGAIADAVSGSSNYEGTQEYKEDVVVRALKKAIIEGSLWSNLIQTKFAHVDRKNAWENFEHVEKILKESV